MLLLMAISISGYPYAKYATLIFVPYVFLAFYFNPKIDRWSLIFIWLTLLNICILSAHSVGVTRTTLGMFNLILLYVTYLKYQRGKFFNANVIILALYLTVITYFTDDYGQNKNSLIIPAMVVILAMHYLILNNKFKLLSLLFFIFAGRNIAISYSRQGVIFLITMVLGLIHNQKVWLIKSMFFIGTVGFGLWLLEAGYLWRFSKLVSFDLIQSTARYEAFLSAFIDGNFKWYGNSLTGKAINSISTVNGIYFDSTFALLSYATGIFGIAWLLIFIFIIYRNVDKTVFVALFLLLCFNEFYEFEQLIVFAFLLSTRNIAKS